MTALVTRFTPSASIMRIADRVTRRLTRLAAMPAYRLARLVGAVALASVILLSATLWRVPSEASVTATTSYLSFVVGALPDDRVRIFAPGNPTDFEVRNVSQASFTTTDDGAAAHSINLRSSTGACKFRISNSRLYAARPAKGDRMTIRWSDTQPQWVTLDVRPPVGGDALREMSMQISDAHITDISNCETYRDAQRYTPDVPIHIRLARPELVVMSFSRGMSFSFWMSGSPLEDDDIPLEDTSSVDTIRATDSGLKTSVLSDGGKIDSGGSPLLIAPLDFVRMEKSKRAVLKHVTLQQGIRFTVAGTFGVLETGPTLELMTDRRRTLGERFKSEPGLMIYLALVAASVSFVMSLLCNYKLL
jgi:hypothetical protein